MHVQESLHCHAVQAKLLLELLQLVLIRSHVLYFVHHRKFLCNLSGLLSQSLQGICYATVTTNPPVLNVTDRQIAVFTADQKEKVGFHDISRSN